MADTEGMALVDACFFVLFSLGGAVFGMGEEALPFTMILCPLFIQEDPKPICVATYVTSTAMTVSYPTATNSGQRILLDEPVLCRNSTGNRRR